MRRSGRSGKQQRRRIGLGGRRPDAEKKLRFAGCRASRLAPLGREVGGLGGSRELLIGARGGSQGRQATAARELGFAHGESQRGGRRAREQEQAERVEERGRAHPLLRDHPLAGKQEVEIGAMELGHAAASFTGQEEDKNTFQITPGFLRKTTKRSFFHGNCKEN